MVETPQRRTIAFARRQMIAAVEAWAASGHSAEKLLFILRTMPIKGPSGDLAIDAETAVGIKSQMQARLDTPHTLRLRSKRERRRNAAT